MTPLLFCCLLGGLRQASFAGKLGPLYIKFHLPAPPRGYVPGWIDHRRPGSNKPVGFVAWIPRKPGVKDYFEAPDYHRIANAPFQPIPGGHLAIDEKPSFVTLMAAQCSAFGFAPISERLVADEGIGKDPNKAMRCMHDAVWAYWMDMAKTHSLSRGRAMGVLSHTPDVDGIPLNAGEQKFLASMKRH